MKPLTLAQIARACGGIARGEAVIQAVCIDTRKVTPGCLFVCIRGERFDAHAFAAQAVAAGAAAVLCHQPVDCAAPTVEVADTRKALLDLARYYRSQFSIPVVGLTGSVGKTTTKEMTHLVLSARYQTLKTQGNLNNEIGLPMTLFQLEEETQAAVIEMGMSHLGEISRLSRTACPTLGMITKIGVSHMENLGSREGILKAKMELADGLSPGAPLILNGDDSYLSRISLPGHPLVYTGIENTGADFVAENLQETAAGMDFLLRFGQGTLPVHLPALGAHNVYNALEAFACGMQLGVDPQAAVRALEQYQPAGMRQRSVERSGVTFIEDCYNASPDSMEAALNMLQTLPAGKRIAVVADMLELGDISAQAHRDVGHWTAEKRVDCLLAYGEESRNTVEEARACGLANARHFSKKEDVAQALLQELDSGAAVLFKASRGMKMEDVIKMIYERWPAQ